jgi:putative transposase
MKTQGAINLKMGIEGKDVVQTVHVIPKLHEPFILGIDFIRDHGLSYCPKHHSFYWETVCPLEKNLILTLKERMVIPPLCRRICAVKVEGGLLPPLGIATIQIADMPWIRGGPVLTKREENNHVMIEIRNASPMPRELPRNFRIGTFEEVDAEELMPVEILQGAPGRDEEDKNDEVDVCAVSAKRRGYHRGSSFPAKQKPTPWVGPTRDRYDAKKFIDANVTLNCGERDRAPYLELFYRHGDVFSKHKNDLGRCSLVQHEIHLKDKNPVYIKQFKIPEVHAAAIEDQVKEWLKLDIVQPSMSRYNSPIFVVKKKDGAFRLVQDFRALNAQTYPDRYSMRDVTDCIHEIGKSGSNIFSTIDLTSGFWQMVLKPECREYTAFTVYGMGQYEFKTSPMGLLGCPASFQRLMEAVMKGIPNVLVYIDDILVHSSSHEEHRKTLDAVFRRLEQHNLKIRLEKCCFATKEVEYLGFRLTPDGVLPGTDKTGVIRSAAPPDNVQRVRQFLGLCNFFRNHIKDFAVRSHPLTVLTKKDCDWKGGPLPPDALKSFNELKTALTSTPIVSFPRKDRQYALITDAATGDDHNPGGMGAILTQIDKEGKFYVISYASRKLVKHEANYTPFLLEMHAAVWGMEHFSHHLKGKRFLLFTDHKPLEKLGKVHTKTLHRIQEAMMEYDFEIFYKKGEEMPADFLSRNINSLSPELSLQNICRLQNSDTQLRPIIQYLKSGNLPSTKADRQLIAKYASRCFLENDVLWIRFHRPEIGSRSIICLPRELHKTAIEYMHSSWYGGHCGALKTVERILLYFYWPNIHNDVKTHISQCERCQKRQTNPKIPSAQLQPLPLMSEPNQRIHADLFGPLRVSNRGKKFILVLTDAFT